jgi:molecular chaperone GrpE
MFKSKKEKLEKEELESELDNIELTDDIPEDIPDEENGDKELKKSEKEDKKVENKKLKELQSRNDALKDQLLRKAAEFENYKRRTENEISNIYKFAGENLISDLLPSLEDFSRVMKLWEEKHDVDAFQKGVELVYGKFRKILEKQGLKEIESIGKPFDVNLHDAIMQMENGEVDPDTVIDEVEKGYLLKDKVIRHSKVVVSKKPE